jgi:CRISPR/Cas system-associated endoribonuclease Cas2
MLALFVVYKVYYIQKCLYSVFNSEAEEALLIKLLEWRQSKFIRDSLHFILIGLIGKGGVSHR